MRTLARILLAVALALIGVAGYRIEQAGAATATPPRTVAAGVLWYTDIASTVTVEAASTIKLTNIAYRHPEQVQAVVVTTGPGTYEIRDRCQPYRLPHTWIVYVDGVVVASTGGLKCQ